MRPPSRLRRSERADETWYRPPPRSPAARAVTAPAAGGDGSDDGDRADSDSRREYRADGGRTSGSLAGESGVDGGALLAQLAAADVVTTGERGELFLAADVRRTWEAGMRRLRGVSDAELAAATASAAPFPAEGRLDESGDWIVVTRTAGDDTDDIEDSEDSEDSDNIVDTDDSDDAVATDSAAETVPGAVDDDVWLSRAHAVADTAAVAALSGRVDALTAARAAAPLRLFLETCPACGGTVEETAGADRSGTTDAPDGPETAVLACVECGEPLYEL